MSEVLFVRTRGDRPRALSMRLFLRLFLVGVAAFVIDVSLPTSTPEFWRGFLTGLAATLLLASLLVAAGRLVARR